MRTRVTGDFGTGQVESAPLDYGPGPSGTAYTDPATITALQKKLAAMGHLSGKVDGVYGPKTEAALYAATGQHGPPDAQILARVGLRPHGEPSQEEIAAAQRAVQAAKSKAQTATTPQAAQVARVELDTAEKKLAVMTAGTGSFLTVNVPGLNRPLWQIALGSLGAIAFGVGVYQLVGGRRRSAR